MPLAPHPRQAGNRFGDEIADRTAGSLGLSPCPPHGFDGTETVIERYMSGMCDIYARALQRLIGGQLVALVSGPAKRRFLIHAGTLVEGLVHDVRQSLPPEWFRQDYSTRRGARLVTVTAEDLDRIQNRDPAASIRHVDEAHALLLATLAFPESQHYRELHIRVAA